MELQSTALPLRHREIYSMHRIKMTNNRAPLRVSNSASSLSGRNYKSLRPQPPSTHRNRPASGRAVTNAMRFRRMALEALGNIVNKIPNMSNENFQKEVVSRLQLIKNFKNFGKLSINNIPVLIAAQNSKLRRRQAWS